MYAVQSILLVLFYFGHPNKVPHLDRFKSYCQIFLLTISLSILSVPKIITCLCVFQRATSVLQSPVTWHIYSSLSSELNTFLCYQIPNKKQLKEGRILPSVWGRILPLCEVCAAHTYREGVAAEMMEGVQSWHYLLTCGWIKKQRKEWM